jgi:ABC-2 type transport system ATP-binding protein
MSTSAEQSQTHTSVQGGAVLEVDGLVVRYGSRTAVDGVAFRIARGEILGLLGPNGAGKTTTLSVIEGLRRPASGSVNVDDRRSAASDRCALPARHATAELGFQPELSIEQLLRLYAGLYGVRLTRATAREALDGVGLEQEASKRLKGLSGGQAQRFSLLIATLHDPLLLLLDEPTSGLDPQSRRSLWQRIEASRRRGGSICSTHSMEEAQAVCDRIVIIDHGRIVATSPPNSSPRTARIRACSRSHAWRTDTRGRLHRPDGK